ncbi:hypothetical protein [Laspinema olomoucense]|uniref:Uncharacterized protein n=1 Tax=Laspinema olomoucense D3b TaxID=2953688 RepID=A0ABT2N506_9CYAN|nr:MULTISPECIES: hypothetical protein [unclassified Laspinema]MCT7970652.1 hypothetical protein [Laspinema sp. D3d]MCT7976845.1 hypothetical protein [Laspinema sp. D3b]MCT7987775.1 hypothetical protein [Laspinema sp. D3a]MCT7996807.1 hypothetical protein [Laspinema sp. D3c]
MMGMFWMALITSLTAWFCYMNTSEEIPRILAIAVGAMGVGCDLVIAPWPIQLSIVLFILYRTRHLSPPPTKAS